MKWIKGVKKINEAISSSTVTIGNFDGLHLGHQKLLNKVLELSKKHNTSSVVMTFDPHPQKILFPDRDLKRLFSIEDQQRVLEQMGFDYYITEPFSRDLSSLSPERFFIDWLYKPLQPKALVVGYDFSFGANREGSSEYLARLAKDYDFELHIIPPYKMDGEIVSSSLIRKLVSTGQVAKARKMLGRPFYLEGVVETGMKRGKSIGFPTANLYTVAETFPSSGVYACNVYYKGKRYVGVTNVGVNPTFDDDTKRFLQVETYILNFDEDIYGEKLEVEFLEFLRAEKKFSGVEELVSQIKKDVDYVRKNYN